MDIELKPDKTKSNEINVNPGNIKNIEICLELPQSKIKNQFVNKWIKEHNFDDADDISSIPDDFDSTASVSNLSERFNEINLNTTEYSSSSMISSSSYQQQNNLNTNNNSNSPNNIYGLKDTINQISNVTSSLKNIGNVHVESSHDIHIGNITYITGPIHVTQTNGGNVGVINQSAVNREENQETSQLENSNKVNCGTTDAEFSEENVPRESNFLERDFRCVILSNTLRIVSRRQWLAQKPMNPYKYIKKPVPYVIISHTATENPTTQPENVQVIRYIQVYHVESNKWDDIGYNFLIGGDGQAYEGRNWDVVGAHAKGYNQVSVGISFVGCYMKELPTQTSIQTCKLLIQSGVEQGYIAKDYKLLGHCQCSPTESPGRMLFEELKTWDHFSNAP